MVRTDKTLDIQGLISPRAETITGNTLAAMEPGQVLTVVTTDRTARQKLPSLCETLGCTLLELREDRGTLYFQIRK
jgi:TusA-related sulfurtransferase